MTSQSTPNPRPVGGNGTRLCCPHDVHGVDEDTGYCSLAKMIVPPWPGDQAMPPEGTDEWDSAVASAVTGNPEDYSYLDDSEGER